MEDENNGGLSLEEKAVEMTLKNNFGARLKTADLERADGSIPESIDKGLGHSMGVLAQLLQATKENGDYRTALHLAKWMSRDDARKCCNAIDEANLLGQSLDPIIDRLMAFSAGENGWFINLVVEGLTHTTFTTNKEGKGGGFRWPGKKNSGHSSVST